MLQEMPVETLSIRLKGCPLSTLTYLSKAAAAAAKSLQSCPTLRDPIDGSPPGPPVPGVLQAAVLGWGAIAFSVSKADGAKRGQRQRVNAGRGPVGDSPRHQAERQDPSHGAECLPPPGGQGGARKGSAEPGV